MPASVPPRGGPSLELDLDELKPQPKLPPAPAPARAPEPPARPAPVARAAAPAPAVRTASGELDLDLSNASGAALPAKLAQSAGQSTGLRIGPDGKIMLPKDRVRGATRSSAGLDEDGHDPFEIRAYADYGDPPDQVWLTPLYAYRVKKRRAELVAELKERALAAAAADEKIEDAVVAFGERARPIAKQNPIYARALAPIEEVEQLAFARDNAALGDMEEYRAATTRVDVQLHELETKLHHVAQAKLGVEMEVEKLEMARSRAEALAKRAEIDLRNAEQSAGSAPAQGAMRVHVGERTSERERQLAEAARLAPLVEAERKKIDPLRAEAVAIERQISAVRKERHEAEEKLKRKSSTRSKGSEDARLKLRAAYGDFGRTALTDAKSFGGEFGASRAAIEALVRDKQEKERAVAMVEKAIGVADERVVSRGITVAVAFAVGFVLLVFGFPIYRMLVPAKPPPLYPVDE